MVTRLPVRRRYRGRLAAIVAAAAVIIIGATVLLLPRFVTPSGAVTVVIPLHATTAAKAFGVGSATGQATARHAAGT